MYLIYDHISIFKMIKYTDCNTYGHLSCDMVINSDTIWLRNKYIWSLMEWYGHILTINNNKYRGISSYL